MKIQDLQNLDPYKCSLQDINKACEMIGVYLQKLIISGHTTTYNFKGRDKYAEAKKLHVSMSKARLGQDKEGFMIPYNSKIDRLPNSESVL